jgi:hypothetical protein
VKCKKYFWKVTQEICTIATWRSVFFNLSFLFPPKEHSRHMSEVMQYFLKGRTFFSFFELLGSCKPDLWTCWASTQPLSYIFSSKGMNFTYGK